MRLNLQEIFNFDFIVAPKNTHQQILLLKNDFPFSHTKLVDENYVYDNLLYTVKDEAIYEILNNCENNIELSFGFLNNLVTINNYDKTMKTLQKEHIFNMLREKQLINYSPVHEVLFKNKRVLIINYSKHNSKLFHVLQQNGAQIEYYRNDQKADLEVVAYQSVISETFSMFNKIAELITNGVAPSDIFIISPGEDYNYAFLDAGKKFDLPLNFNNTYPLLSYPSVKKFFAVFDTSVDVKETIEQLRDEYGEDKAFLALEKVLVSFPQKDLEANVYLEFLKYILKAKNINEFTYIKTVNVVSDFSHLNEGKHVFIPDFSNNVYPRVYSDSDFFTDNENLALGNLTTLEKNKGGQEQMISLLSSPNKFYLSYSLLKSGVNNEKSSLVNLLGIKQCNFLIPRVVYSRDYLEYLYTLVKDDEKNYNVQDTRISQLEKQFSIDNYLSYDNSFTGVDAFNKNTYLKLSFTNTENYFRCPFVYYLEKVLKIRKTDNEYYMNYGNFVHKIIEESVKDDFDFDDFFLTTLDHEDYKFSVKEKTIINNNKRIVKYATIFNKSLIRDFSVDKVLSECNLNVNIDEFTVFEGRLDRIFLINDKLIITDYKTGKTKFAPQYLDYGLSLQLPVYSYLIRNIPELQDKTIIGMYIQTISEDKIIIFDDARSEEDHYIKLLRFKGITSSSDEVFNLICGPDERSPKYIANADKKKDGTFGAYSVVGDEEKFQELAIKAEEKIKEAAKRIRDNDFRIVYTKMNVDEKYEDDILPYEDIAYYDRNKGQIVSLKIDKDDDNNE